MKTIAIITTGLLMMVLVATRFPGNETPEKSNEGIHFKTGTWAEALKLAKAENKPIFLDISTSWCGWCKRMKSKVFTNADVANYYNSNFINVSVDAEKGEGIKLKNKYGVTGYPTFVFIKPDGSLAKKHAGYRSPEKFIQLGKSI